MLQTKDYKHFQVGDFSFEGGQLANKALPGDHVEICDGQVKLIKRVQHKLVGTLELASKYRYGMTAKNHPIYLFTPFSESYPPFYVGSAHKGTENVLAIAEFAHWTETCPRGNLERILGIAGELSIEEEALALHAVNAKWKTQPLVEPSPLPTGPTAFHIDPPGCRDIDDAITLTAKGNSTEVQIHIADVASWLALNPWLMRAEEFGQTLYKDGVAVKPMFPLELSEGAFSLLPGEDRRVYTLRFLWNRATKTMEGVAWFQQMIRVTQSFTYDSITPVIAKQLEEICSSLAGRPITDSHEWIEQLMLLYNREAAKVLREKGQGILRRHKKHDCYDLYQTLGLPANRLAMAAGEYCLATDTDTKHWGLGQDVYCHATSPIRRWSDCVNQMVLLGHEILPRPGHLNARSKALKAYERDLTLVRALLGPAAVLDGVILENRVWIPAWGHILKVDTTLEPGQKVLIKYFCDATKRNWKRRLVLKLEPADPVGPVLK